MIHYFPDYKPKAWHQKGIAKPVVGALGAAVDLLNAPLYMTAGAVNQFARGNWNPLNIPGSMVQGLANKTDYIDVAKRIGMEGAGAAIAGTAGNIFLDPLNIFGVAKLAKTFVNPSKADDVLKLSKAGNKVFNKISKEIAEEVPDTMGIVARRTKIGQKTFDTLSDMAKTNKNLLYTPGISLHRSGKMIAPFAPYANFAKSVAGKTDDALRGLGGIGKAYGKAVDTIGDIGRKVGDIGRDVFVNKVRDPVVGRLEEMFKQGKGASEIISHRTMTRFNKIVGADETRRNLVRQILETPDRFMDTKGNLFAATKSALQTGDDAIDSVIGETLKLVKDKYDVIDNLPNYNFVSSLNLEDDIYKPIRYFFDNPNDFTFRESEEYVKYIVGESADVSDELTSLALTKADDIAKRLGKGEFTPEMLFDVRDLSTHIPESMAGEFNNLRNRLEDHYKVVMSNYQKAIKEGTIVNLDDAWAATGKIANYNLKYKGLPQQMMQVVDDPSVIEAVKYAQKELRDMIDSELASGIQVTAREGYLPHVIDLTTEKGREAAKKIALGGKPGFAIQRKYKGSIDYLNHKFGKNFFIEDVGELLAIRKYKSEIAKTQRSFMEGVLKLGKRIPEDDVLRIKQSLGPDEAIYVFDPNSVYSFNLDIEDIGEALPFKPTTPDNLMPTVSPDDAIRSQLGDLTVPEGDKAAFEAIEKTDEYKALLKKEKQDYIAGAVEKTGAEEQARGFSGKQITTEQGMNTALDDVGKLKSDKSRVSNIVEEFKKTKAKKFTDSEQSIINEVAQGITSTKKAADKVHVLLPKDAVTLLNRYQKTINDPSTLKRFMNELFFPVQNWWKAWVMGSTPSTMFRNVTGNVYNNWLAGVKLGDYDIARKLLDNIDNVDELAKIQVNTLYGTMNGVDFMDEFIRGGIMDKGLFGRDIKKGMQIIDDEAIDAMTRKTSDLLSLNPTKNPVPQEIFKTQTYVENLGYLAHYYRKMEDGYDSYDAILSVKKYLFDYGDLTQTEQEVLKAIFPFYTFTKNNLPLQLEHLITDPLKYTAIAKVKWMTNELAPGNDSDFTYLPEWLAHEMAIKMPWKDEDGNYLYLDYTDWIPAAQINILSNPIEEMTRMTSPLIKMPVEIGLNYNTYYGEPISKYPGQKERMLGISMDKRIAYMLKQMRMINELDRLIAYKKPTGGREFPERLLRYGTGIRADRYNPELSKQIVENRSKRDQESAIWSDMYKAKEANDQDTVDYLQNILQSVPRNY